MRAALKPWIKPPTAVSAGQSQVREESAPLNERFCLVVHKQVITGSSASIIVIIRNVQL